ncbi:acyltransferase [Dokdonia sinensis]|uniref:Acyltransferase n=1 Tax=Dokdonia sinensis TaxID=2479847 RepID=A0A3M0FXM1_9FLAO|nr:acyltransferase [Dokdonia sinensis]RMB57424.1 acyltransferase [Dokdonia sinensis]
MKRHYNNFDFLRFLFAIFVIITHSFALSGVGEEKEWLYAITNRQLSFSGLGLSGFFVISGFFIYRSCERSRNLWDYLKKRVLRVFPGLLVVLVLSLLIVPFIYEGETSLLSNRSYWTYGPYNLSLYGFQGVISGVFDHHPYKSINGSLWTIRYEFSLYLAIALLFLVRKQKRLIVALVCVVLLVMMFLFHFALDQVGGAEIAGMVGVHILNLGGFFVVGTLLATLDFEKWNSLLLVGVSFVLILVSIHLDFFITTKHLLLPLVVLGIGFIPLKGISSFSKYGDASYGIYIYAFPIQQLLLYFLKPSILVFILSSMSLAIIFGYLSWHLIEKKALELKSK